MTTAKAQLGKILPSPTNHALSIFAPEIGGSNPTINVFRLAK